MAKVQLAQIYCFRKELVQMSNIVFHHLSIKAYCRKQTVESIQFPTDDTAEDNQPSYTPATVSMMVEENGQALNGNGQQSCQQIPTQIPISPHSMQHGQDYSLTPTSIQNLLQAPGNYPWNTIPGGGIFVEGVNHSNVQPPVQEYYVDASFRCNQVLHQWDEPHVEVKKHWNFLDQLMPLYSTQSGFYRENFPSTSLMDKAHKLLASISSGDYGLKMITSVTNRATQTPQRRGVLICPIEPYDSDDEPPVKKQRNAKYQLRFVNRVCNDYYTREQIKSEDGNILKVALYDENNLVVTSGPLSSASVEVVLLHGDFNAEGQDYWTSEEFSACLVHPQSVKESPALGGDRALALTDGEAELGNAYFQSSSFHARTGKFKMGAEIKSVREESVQEGITSPFLVRVRQGKDLRSKEERTTMQGAPADSLGAAEAAARPSRYDSQKRRDWNTFRQYLRNHRPPLELSRFSGAHVLEFLRYLDQFGKTKVHAAGCHSFGHPSSLAACPCPLRQAWGSLDALVGRLRAAFEEHGGQPEANPFGARAVRIYLREVRDSQAKARGIRMPKAVMPEKE